MELFSLLAKLTLDKSEYDKSISEAESQTKNITIDEPTLGLDTSEFDAEVESIPDTEIGNPDNPDVGLDTGEFDSEVESIPETEVGDPKDPELGLDTKEFKEGVDDAKETGSIFSDSLGAIFSNLGGVLAASGIVAAVAGVVSSLKEGVELAKNHGDQIDKQSQKMGISAKAYQEWSYALTLSGASINDLNKGLKTWRSSIGDDKKEQNLVEAFEALGLSADDAFEQIEKAAAGQGTLDNLLETVMTRLAEYDEGDRGRLMKLLFGNNSTELMALLGQTGEQIKDALSEADELGLVMTDEEVKNAAAYMDATTRMEQSIQALKESMAKDLLPVLTDAANTVAKIVAFFNPRTSYKSLSEQWAGDDEAFAEELATIEGTAVAAESLADKLLAMGDTSKMTADEYAIWKGTAEELIKLVPTLGDVIDTESGKINANSEEIKENIKQWENLAKQKALQTLKEEKYQDIVKRNAELIDKSVEANRKAAEADGKRAESFRKLNEVLTSNGYNALNENATYEEAQQAVTNALLNYSGDEYGLARLSTELTSAQQEWASAEAAAMGAQAEAEKLKADLEEGEKEYQEWLKAAENLYGIIDETASDAKSDVDAVDEALKNLPRNVHTVIDIEYNELNPRPFATGSAYIPYDNFPALLHRGEKVITATEARRGEKSEVSSTDLEDRIIAAIREGMADASVTAVVTDRQVARGANNYNGNEMDSRRFRP